MRMGVGPDRFLRQAWLDAVADLVSEGRDAAHIEACLDGMLADEIQGKEARVKTRRVLMRVWVMPFPERVVRRDEALELWRQVEAPDRLWLHWGLLLSTYAAFFDLAGAVGRLLSLQGNFTTDQVLRRMTEQWGHREIIEKVTRLGLRSLIDWGVLATDSAGGAILPTLPLEASLGVVQLWLLGCALPQDGGAIALDDLLSSPQLFPFRVTMGIGDILGSDALALDRQGGGLDVVRLREAAGRIVTQGLPKPPAKAQDGSTLTVASVAAKPSGGLRPSRVYLVACVSQKKDGSDQAQHLYTSPLFQKARAYALRHADRWYILSAKHGLVSPEQVIDPYETTLNRMPVAERRAWAERVSKQLAEVLTLGDDVVFLAGKHYREGVAEGLECHGHKVEIPMEGLTIGRQLSWLDHAMREEGD